MIKKISKGIIIIFIIFWMFNCASEETISGDGIPQKEKPADEVELAPRPTRLKK